MRSVLILCRRYVPGQAWTTRMLAYARALIELGYSVRICFLIADKDRTHYVLPIKGAKIINLWERDRWLSRKIRVLSYIVNRHRIKSIVNDEDICLMFDAGGCYLRELKQTRLNIVTVFEVTEHPEIVIHPPFQKTKIRKWLTQMRQMDYLFVITNSLKDYAISMGVNKRKIHVVNIFVDIERFFSKKKTYPQNDYIGYCGTLSCYKDGVDILIRAFALFHKIYPNYSLHLYGAGQTPDTINQLKSLAEGLGISDYVCFKGLIPFEEMPQVLVDAKVLALSRPNNIQNSNGFPTKLGEYLATGNPVLVTSVGEIPLFIKDGLNGYLAQPNDVVQFANKLTWIISHYDVAMTVGQRGRELAQNEFSNIVQVKKAFSSIIK